MRQDMDQVGVVDQHPIWTTVFIAFAENQALVKLPDGRTFPVQIYTKSKCRHVVVDGYDYVEQNHSTGNDYAERAKAGQTIIWIFRGREYAGLLEDDGEVFLKKWLIKELQAQAQPNRKTEIRALIIRKARAHAAKHRGDAVEAEPDKPSWMISEPF